jgi:hypothetical protein
MKLCESSYNALFISSYSTAALEAVNEIIKIAPQFPQINFYIIGGIGTKFTKLIPPQNIIITGLITEDEKQRLLQTSDFALNPIVNGSGLNIKMLEYFSTGIPVICTEFGARGIMVKDGVNCLLTKFDLLAETIRKFITLDTLEKDRLAVNAYNLFKNNYTWRNCVIKLISHLKKNFKINLSLNATLNSTIYFKEYNNQIPITPVGDIYIFGASEWGLAYLKLLTKQNITPIAFIDNDQLKWGNTVNGIPILPPNSFSDIKGEYSIVFALAKFIDAVKQMKAIGINQNNILIAIWGIHVFRPFDVDNGNIPAYIDLYKIKSSLQI